MANIERSCAYDDAPPHVRLAPSVDFVSGDELLKPIVFNGSGSLAIDAAFNPFGETGAIVAKPLFDDPAAGVTFGIGEVAAGADIPFRAPTHVFIAGIAGAVEVDGEDGRTFLIGEGEAAHIAASAEARIRAKEKCTLAVGCFVATAQPSNGGSIVKVDPQATLAPSRPLPADWLLSSTPTQLGRDSFANGTGSWRVGVWKSTAYHRKTIPFPRHEFMLLLDGGVTLTEPAGSSFTFKAGDIFLLPIGWKADWKTPDRITKIFCTYTPV